MAAYPFISPIDLNGHEILNVRMQALAAPPDNPAEGRFYFDTVIERPRIFADGVWRNMTGVENPVLGVTGTAPIVVDNTDPQNPVITITLVSQAAAGAMSAADKAKLDGIEAGATTDQTKAEIDALLINADTVDGSHAADLLDRTNHTGTQPLDTITGHNKAVHDALGINADQVDGFEAAALLDRTNHTGTQPLTTITGHDKAAHDALNIDADTLDGLDATDFAGAAHHHDAAYVNEVDHTKALHDAMGIDAATVEGQDAAALRDRGTHTGTQPASTISDFHAQVQTNRLDQMAEPTADVGMGGNRLTDLADPVNPGDAATKAYVDAARQGLDTKASVRVATTGPIALNGTPIIDGVQTVAGDRVLVKNQVDSTTNGIYVVAAGAWTRAEDADSNADITAGMFTFVTQGDTQADSGWTLITDDPIDLTVSGLSFTQFSGAGQIDAGDGLSKVGNRLDVNLGDGLVLDGDDIAVDAGYVVRKHTQVVGDGASTVLGVTHNLGTEDVDVVVRYAANPGQMVGCAWRPNGVNAIQLLPGSPPANNELRVSVMG